MLGINKNILRLFLSLAAVQAFPQVEQQHNRGVGESSRPATNEPGVQVATEINFGFGSFSHPCVGTLIAKQARPNSPGVCDLVYLTAAHCLYEKAEWFDSINIPGLKRVAHSQARFAVASEHLTSVINSKGVMTPRDTALINIAVQCDTFEDTPFCLSPVSSNELISPENTVPLFTQKRTSPIQVGKQLINSGGGGIVRGQRELNVNFGNPPTHLAFRGKTTDGKIVEDADSGAPVFNSSKEIVGVMKGSTQEGSDIFLFDPFGVDYARQTLKEWEISQPEKCNSPLAAQQGIKDPVDPPKAEGPRKQSESSPLFEPVGEGLAKGPYENRMAMYEKTDSQKLLRINAKTGELLVDDGQSTVPASKATKEALSQYYRTAAPFTDPQAKSLVDLFLKNRDKEIASETKPGPTPKPELDLISEIAEASNKGLEELKKILDQKMLASEIGQAEEIPPTTTESSTDQDRKTDAIRRTREAGKKYQDKWSSVEVELRKRNLTKEADLVKETSNRLVEIYNRLANQHENGTLELKLADDGSKNYVPGCAACTAEAHGLVEQVYRGLHPTEAPSTPTPKTHVDKTTDSPLPEKATEKTESPKDTRQFTYVRIANFCSQCEPYKQSIRAAYPDTWRDPSTGKIREQSYTLIDTNGKLFWIDVLAPNQMRYPDENGIGGEFFPTQYGTLDTEAIRKKQRDMPRAAVPRRLIR